jgi:predicted thioesterase
MNPAPPIGAAGELRFTVADEHTIAFPPAPPVLSTPSLVWFLEHAAIRALEPHLPKGRISLGGEINLQHLAPTPAGQTVTCVARLIGIEGGALLFQVEARDAAELIARGTHRRFVVPADAFARRVRRKAAP